MPRPLNYIEREMTPEQRAREVRGEYIFRQWLPRYSNWLHIRHCVSSAHEFHFGAFLRDAMIKLLAEKQTSLARAIDIVHMLNEEIIHLGSKEVRAMRRSLQCRGFLKGNRAVYPRRETPRYLDLGQKLAELNQLLMVIQITRTDLRVGK